MQEHMELSEQNRGEIGFLYFRHNLDGLPGNLFFCFPIKRVSDHRDGNDGFSSKTVFTCITV